VAAVSRDEFRAWRAFLDAQASLLRRLEDELVASEGMTLGELDALIQLRVAQGGRLRMTELSERVRLSRSGLFDRLVSEGLVGRVSCASDRRGYFASITAAGRERLRRARPIHLKSVHEHFGRRLSPAQLAAVADALEPLGQDMPGSLANREAR